MRTVLLCTGALMLGVVLGLLLAGLGAAAKAAHPDPPWCAACASRGYQVAAGELTPRACWCPAGTEWHRLHPHVTRVAPPP